MELQKKYIIQAISVASNNLRLSSDKIETVAILREHFEKCNMLDEEIQKMKTKTELSKFAIKLGEAYRYISSAQIDFLKITDTFKEHSYNLVMELSNLLDLIPPEQLREILFSLHKEETIEITLDEKNNKIEFPSQIHSDEKEENDEHSTDDSAIRDGLKEELILGEIDKTNKFNFDDFEEEILKPITGLENLLRAILSHPNENIDLNKMISVLKKNALLSSEIGFSIITEMHEILFTALGFIEKKRLDVNKSLIESMRACLIVIVAVVRDKDVDITNYLNRAENLGEFLKTL